MWSVRRRTRACPKTRYGATVWCVITVMAQRPTWTVASRRFEPPTISCVRTTVRKVRTTAAACVRSATSATAWRDPHKARRRRLTVDFASGRPRRSCSTWADYYVSPSSSSGLRETGVSNFPPPSGLPSARWSNVLTRAYTVQCNIGCIQKLYIFIRLKPHFFFKINTKL